MTSSVNPPAERDAWPRRRAKAGLTRAAVIDAAAELFVQRGYLATSLQAIADAAGVSRATLFNSVGGKVQLLRAAYDVAIVGDDEPVPLPQRREAQAVIDEPDPTRAIEAYAAMATAINRRVVGIYEVFRSVAVVEPAVRSQWEQIQQERLGGARGFVRIMAAKGPLRTGLDPERAGDVIWTLLDASLYQRLVVERAWSPEQFQAWLAWRMRSELLLN